MEKILGNTEFKKTIKAECSMHDSSASSYIYQCVISTAKSKCHIKRWSCLYYILKQWKDNSATIKHSSCVMGKESLYSKDVHTTRLNLLVQISTLSSVPPVAVEESTHWYSQIAAESGKH